VPRDSDTSIDADAIVVALKSRTIARASAVEQSLEALRWLQVQGVHQVYFKYCSTFDSTADGNIGPVTDALLDALHGPGHGFTIACPAFPENQRTVSFTDVWPQLVRPVQGSSFSRVGVSAKPGALSQLYERASSVQAARACPSDRSERPGRHSQKRVESGRCIPINPAPQQ